ncbi:DUF5710 domain-containing protein [Pseudoduganella violaceinigra]|uniref:DUF5710 domain-containing protein n=1 Tax=Pseudoduganella violaceinigra TaxID=246602 RepID=UPI001E477B1F|nr:DUF5710 domain-containing protein [Pseudoduganella violaceinigra]
MYPTVPFDPPYVKRISSEAGDRWVSVSNDGTEVPCDAAPSWTTETFAKEVQASAPPAAKVSKGTILNVPYAEKDEAKRLGARWDAARKKWYVPPGVSMEPFSRWTSGS